MTKLHRDASVGGKGVETIVTTTTKEEKPVNVPVPESVFEEAKAIISGGMDELEKLMEAVAQENKLRSQTLTVSRAMRKRDAAYDAYFEYVALREAAKGLVEAAMETNEYIHNADRIENARARFKPTPVPHGTAPGMPPKGSMAALVDAAREQLDSVVMAAVERHSIWIAYKEAEEKYAKEIAFVEAEQLERSSK